MDVGIMLIECFFIPEPFITVFAQGVAGIPMLAETSEGCEVPLAEVTVGGHGRERRKGAGCCELDYNMNRGERSGEERSGHGKRWRDETSWKGNQPDI